MKRIATRRMLTVITILFVMGIFACQSFAWTISRDFEGGTAGQTATGPNGFFWASGITYSNVRAHSGTTSVAAQYIAGVADVPGATFEGNGATVPEGGEAWYRVYLYYPGGWNWSSNPASKVFRFTTNASSNQHLSVYASPAGEIVTSLETNDGPESQVGTGTNLDVGSWQCVELYVKLSSVAGQGIYRIWKNGKLIYETKSLKTLVAANQGIADYHILFNYWNGGPTQNQIAYVDDLKITSETPSNVDAAGNRMIGPTDWGGSTINKLAAPTRLVARRS